MIFKGLHPLTGETLWGCPMYSRKSNRWIVEWYDEETRWHGETNLTTEQLLWVLANPGEVAKLQDKVTDWLVPF